LIDQISPELLKFIVSGVHSIEQLEIMLLLRADCSRSWTTEQINSVIRSTEESISKRLEHLVSQKLVRADSENPLTFRYDPATPILRNMAERLVEAYNTQRAEVTELIYNKPADNIVGFANAFKLNKDDSNG
jgi:hypothetical protein